MSTSCRKCGKPTGSDGNCQSCLLQLGMSRTEDSAVSNLQYASLPSISELSEQFPQLQIHRLVGRGGMGAIYHARQTALDRDVALKLIARDVANDTSFLDRFEREAKTLAKLSHPNIVTIFDFGRTADGQAYLIMEFVDGINLREALQAKSVGHDDALEIVSTICKALAYAHSKGVVHRDIKPENILLGEDGTIKVADFGIAKLVDQSAGTPVLTATRQVLGSLNYLAPEQLEAPNEVDHRVDLYALGVVFYELLTGQLPLGRYDPPSAILGNRVDQRIDAIVMKTLSRKPVQRYQHATELDSALHELRPLHSDQVIGNRAVVANTPPTPQIASVPFSCEAMGGFAEVVGVLYATADKLRAEFRTRDAIWGQLKTKTQVVAIPTSQLRVAELKSGVFSSKIVLMADTISTFDSLPNSETGRVELKIKSCDHNQAVELINTLGISNHRATPRPVPAAGEADADSTRWTILAILTLLCCVINIGSLAITQVLIASELDGRALAAASIAAAFLIGPICILQLVTGCLTLIARPRSLAIATSIVSMFPLTPGWFVSFPVGIWGLSWLYRPPVGREGLQGAVPVSNSKGWGATTMLFIRESRWSKFVALANVGALLLAVALYAGYQAGYYPSTLEYRVVNEDVSRKQLEESLRRRIPGVRIDVVSTPVHVVTDDTQEANALRIHTMANRRSEIIEQLKYEGNVQLAWIRKTHVHHAADAEVSTILWPIAPQLAISANVATRTATLGQQVEGEGEVLILTSEMVSKLSNRDGDKLEQFHLSLEFSAKGRKVLDAAAPDIANTAGLALIVDGVVHGFADHENISNAQTIFTLSNASDASPAAIMAAIRGPELPTELELLH